MHSGLVGIIGEYFGETVAVQNFNLFDSPVTDMLTDNYNYRH